jgi:hypothetical protein
MFFFDSINSQITHRDDDDDIKIMSIFDEKLQDHIGDDKVSKEYHLLIDPLNNSHLSNLPIVQQALNDFRSRIIDSQG